MTTAVLHPFLQAAERDLALFNVSQLAVLHVRWWLVRLLRVVVYPIFLVLAQFVPFIFRQHLALLIPRLPDISAPADLAFAKDALLLYHESMKAYGRFCVFRRLARDVLDEIDEQLDSLEFVTSNKEFLDKAVADIQQR